mgnify:CR=1 FL=1
MIMILSEDISNSLKERFLRYVQVYSESNSENADKGIQPSTSQQKDMAQLLNKELNALGLKDVQTTEFCYTYGFLPATKGHESSPSFCLLSHIDTVDEVTGKDVHPIVHENYNGLPINLKNNVTLDPATDEALALAASEHDTVITADGTTLLGADDKAGVSEIMTLLEFLTKHPEVEHGPIEVIFSPDEETGHGMDNVPLNLLKSKFAYTVDGGHIGELETECFNAYKSDIKFTGISKHTGSARGVMVNAVTMASNFVSSLPRHEAPETTDSKQGFYAPMTISGSIEESYVSLILRDFTKDGMQKRMELVDTLANATALSFGGKAQVTHTKQYENMKEKMDEHPEVVKKLAAAYKNAGVEPLFTPIRGGTDGSRLTEMGIPTPNIFTGGHNFHSRYEWASFSQMKKACEVLIELAKNWA